MSMLRTGLVTLLLGITLAANSQVGSVGGYSPTPKSSAQRQQEKTYYLNDYMHAADFIGNKDGKASDDELEVVRDAIFAARQGESKFGYVPFMMVDDTLRKIHPNIAGNKVPDPNFSPIMVIKMDPRMYPQFSYMLPYEGIDEDELQERYRQGALAPVGLKEWKRSDLNNNYILYEINWNGQLTGIYELTKDGYKKLNIDKYQNKKELFPETPSK